MLANSNSNGPDNAVQRHEAGLIAQAIALTQDHSGVRIVALVAEPDAPEAPLIRAAKGAVLHGPDGSEAVLVTREEALKLLGKLMPQLLDWIPEEEEQADSTRRKLPVVHMARRGMRSEAIEYEVVD